MNQYKVTPAYTPLRFFASTTMAVSLVFIVSLMSVPKTIAAPGDGPQFDCFSALSCAQVVRDHVRLYRHLLADHQNDLTTILNEITHFRADHHITSNEQELIDQFFFMIGADAILAELIEPSLGLAIKSYDKSVEGSYVPSTFYDRSDTSDGLRGQSHIAIVVTKPSRREIRRLYEGRKRVFGFFGPYRPLLVPGPRRELYTIPYAPKIRAQYLVHYTDRQGYEAILNTEQINPSGPNSYLGQGQYFTIHKASDIAAWMDGELTEKQRRAGFLSHQMVFRELYSKREYNFSKLSHYVEIFVGDLAIERAAWMGRLVRPNIFVLRNDQPLSLRNGRITDGGIVTINHGLDR